MSDKTEHIRHIDKTRQDHMPVAERPRVKQWQKRIDVMRNGNGIAPTHEQLQQDSLGPRIFNDLYADRDFEEN